MIRTGIYQLSTRSAKYTPKVASTVVRPAVVAISGKSTNLFSTNPKQRDDALEKETLSSPTPVAEKKGTPKKLSSYYNGPIYRPLLSGFDDFFSPFLSRHDSFFRDPFAPFFSQHDDLMPVLRNDIPRDPHSFLLRTSPGYEIKENKGSYEIAIDVPEGVGASDMNVQVNDDVIHLSGERKVEKDDFVSKTRFDKRFAIGTNVDTDNITANLKDGVLILKAPKLEATEPPKKTIAITEDPHDDAFEELSKQYDPLTSVDDDEKTGVWATLNTAEDISKQYDPLTSTDDDEKDGMKM